MATVEFIYPKCSEKVIPFKGFWMNVKDGPGEYMSEKEHQDELRYLISIPGKEFVFYVGAMHDRISLETGQMIREDIELIQSLDGFFKYLGYNPNHCFGRQDFGRKRVTSEQATRIDALSTQRSSIFIALPTTPISGNAREEVGYRLWLERPVIGLTFSGMEGQNYRNWFIPLVESSRNDVQPSVLITGINRDDLIEGLGRVVSSASQAQYLAQTPSF